MLIDNAGKPAMKRLVGLGLELILKAGGVWAEAKLRVLMTRRSWRLFGGEVPQKLSKKDEVAKGILRANVRNAD
jgi:hypothetical protein